MKRELKSLAIILAVSSFTVPARALLLAGPALSLPNRLVIGSVMGKRETMVFAVLTCIMAAISGKILGTFWG